MTNFEFIKAHTADDIRQLALQAHRYPGIDVPFCIQQIAALKTAAQKLPLWASTDGILFPPHINMEQCSSQHTAQYKADIVAALCPHLTSFTDLTAGFGVDATMIARSTGARLTYVEQNEELCRIAQNNLPLLDVNCANILNADATEVLVTLPHQSLIFLDPARRDTNGGKVVALCDCTPDVTLMQDTLLDHADTVMLKLSPMLDISEVQRTLHHISEIHVVSLCNECKELLVIMQQQSEFRGITCVNILADGTRSIFHSTPGTSSESASTNPFSTSSLKDDYEAEPSSLYLYEPNTSIMKAQPWQALTRAYIINKVSHDSHLFWSRELIPDFPGRTFIVRALSTMNKRELKSFLADTPCANITVRNFPMSVNDLRRRLHLSDGGSTYIFATTDAEGRHLLIKTEKPN